MTRKDQLQELIMEKLCPRGRAYIKARQAAGEKSSAYLSGRAVKVCKGQIKYGGKKKKTWKENLNELIRESLTDWFKKEDWVRIDTQGNIAGPCGTMKKGKATTRCLPRAKANSLTKAERAATTRKKVAGSKKGKQFVSNTPKAKVKFNK
jgi:hypothetical protein